MQKRLVQNARTTALIVNQKQYVRCATLVTSLIPMVIAKAAHRVATTVQATLNATYAPMQNTFIQMAPVVIAMKPGSISFLLRKHV